MCLGAADFGSCVILRYCSLLRLTVFGTLWKKGEITALSFPLSSLLFSSLLFLSPLAWTWRVIWIHIHDWEIFISKWFDLRVNVEPEELAMLKLPIWQRFGQQLQVKIKLFSFNCPFVFRCFFVLRHFSFSHPMFVSCRIHVGAERSPACWVLWEFTIVQLLN